MKKLDVEIKLENNETVVYIENKKVDEEILQNNKTSMAVSVASNVADNTRLFYLARNIINEFKQKYNVIVSGRALMEIYPDLDYHFFVTASLDERVKRKAIQYNENVNLSKLREHIEKRDELQEKSGFYKIYPSTIKVDVTECKSVEESAEKLYKYIKLPCTK